MNDEVVIYSIGLVHLSVCAPKSMSKKDLLDEVNMMHPTGVQSRWECSNNEKFADGKNPNPCECNSNPERLHYLLVC